MANLYLTEQGATLRKTGDRLLVEKDNDLILDVQCHKIDTILIFGNVQFTTQAVHELFEHGIELALLTKKGKLVGQLTPVMPKNIELRIKQYQRQQESDFVLSTSKAIISGKFCNSLAHIKLFSYYHKNLDLKAEISNISDRLKSIDDYNTLEMLLGLEGGIARVYFNAFSKMILSDGFCFTARKKHPATDPVNALLSFGYTLLFNEINSLLDGIGFDPYIGIYHQIRYGRPSLACDLIEEFRAPVIDRFTLSLINSKTISSDDFYKSSKTGGMYLRREALKVYLKKYENNMLREFQHPINNSKLNFRKAIRNQVQLMANCIKTGLIYKPLIFAR